MTRSSEMKRVLSRWQKSGLSLRRFGHEEGISYDRLQYWRRKFEETEPRKPRRRRGQPTTSPEFVPVEVMGTEEPDVRRGDSGFEVRLANGHGVRISTGFDAGELRRLLQVLGSC